MEQVIGDVKCYHCGHISGQVEGERTKHLVLKSFTPRPGYKGAVPKPGDRIRCERCLGPVYLEDLRPLPANPLPFVAPAARKKARAPRSTRAA
jgi:hypothetical protein